MRNCKICRERRQSHFVFQLVNLISGIWGTYNGIYTHQQLDQLRRDLTKVEEHQDRLFAITSTHQTAILQLHTALSALLDSTLRQIANPSSVTNVTLQRLYDMLERNVGKAYHYPSHTNATPFSGLPQRGPTSRPTSQMPSHCESA